MHSDVVSCLIYLLNKIQQLANFKLKEDYNTRAKARVIISVWVYFAQDLFSHAATLNFDQSCVLTIVRLGQIFSTV